MRELMQQMEADLGTKLDWIAVGHHNTGHPHTHILLRGVTEDGKTLNTRLTPRRVAFAFLMSVREDLRFPETRFAEIPETAFITKISLPQARSWRCLYLQRRGGRKSIARFPLKKAGRGWHHHSRALRRRSMGQGG
jgi:hypothetical protein